MGYILVGIIIGGIIWGIVVNKVIENKGYEENWFWWGFFFGIFALIVALTKQNVVTTKVVIESSAQVKDNMELLSSFILNNQVNISSPVHIASWEIKKDTEKLVLFVDFINVSQKAISAVMFSATGFNAFGDIVRVNNAEFFDVIGQDLSIRSNGHGKFYTTLQDEAIRKVEIKVKKICFADGTIVDDIQDEWINTNQSELKPVHIDCAIRENAQSKYYAIIKEHYWQCVCGFVNTQNACAICGMQKKNAVKFTQDNIDDTYNEYIKQIEIEQNEKEKRQSEEKLLQEEQQARAKKNKKILAYSTGIVVVCIVIATVLNAFVIPNYKYNKAIKLIDEQKQMEGILLLSEIGKYKDSSKIIRDYYKQYRGKISVGFDYAIGVKENGKVIHAGNGIVGKIDVSDWENIKAVSAGPFSEIVGLKNDGTVLYKGRDNKIETQISEWEDIVEIAMGMGNVLGLKSDGTVVAIGSNNTFRRDVSAWKDIVQISVNGYHAVGLRADGTVVATGNNDYGQCDVSGWKDIVSVASGELYTLGLKADGTVVAIGDNSKGQCDVSAWNNIVQISASDKHAVGLKTDGTVVAIGENISGQCRVDDWENIVAISTSSDYTLGLKNDGTLVANFLGVIDVSNWDLID